MSKTYDIIADVLVRRTYRVVASSDTHAKQIVENDEANFLTQEDATSPLVTEVIAVKKEKE